MIAFLDDHRGVFGVGPICRVLGIAPSTFYSFKAVERDPTLASDRARQDQKDMTARVILPVLTGRDRRTHTAIFSFMAGVTPPMPMLGRSLL